MRIVAIGKKHESWITEGLNRYQKRLRGAFSVEWILLPYSSKNNHLARQAESEAILQRISQQDYVILLDERGSGLSSVELSQKLQTVSSRQQIVFVIGGAYGVSQQLMERADFVWSLSKLVFPHMLVRLLLIEQIYRSQEISRGGPYHHE